MNQVNGTSILQIKKYVVEKYSNEQYEEMLIELDQEVLNIMKGAILSANMYDINIYQELLRVFEKKYSRKELKDLVFSS